MVETIRNRLLHERHGFDFVVIAGADPVLPALAEAVDRIVVVAIGDQRRAVAQARSAVGDAASLAGAVVIDLPQAAGA